MTCEEQIELPLFKTFMSLMKLEKALPHRSIDPGSYLDLVAMLRNGYMLNSKEELIFFCKKLWLKPFHRTSSVLNERILEELLEANLKDYNDSLPAANSNINPATNPVNPEQKTNPQSETTSNQTPAPEKKSADMVNPETETSVEQSNEAEQLFLSVEEADAQDLISQKDYNDLFNTESYQFNYQYLPVTRRFIEQTIRSLRYKVKGSGRAVIDIPSTVEEIASKGYFDKWKFREEDGFITQWTLLLDRDGSMAAFHSFQDALIDAAVNGTIKNDGDIFYFRNVAEDNIYTDPRLTRSRPFRTFAAYSRKNILIVSDAGAARGYINEDRIDDTYTMLYRLRKHRVAWLNPLPKQRWKNTSAESIAGFVNMFEPGDDNADNFGNIVQLFKSKIILQPSNVAW
jgi:uncharacterized protein with von Willebrand factor type A (vWA) domain